MYNGESTMRTAFADGSCSSSICSSKIVTQCHTDDPALFCCRFFHADNNDARQPSAVAPRRLSVANDGVSNSTDTAQTTTGRDGSTTPNDLRSSAPDGLADRDRRRHCRRLVLKDGTSNVSSSNITRRRLHYLVDIFTTLVDLRWRYTALIFSSAFIVSWLFFGTLWYAIAYGHGDCSHPDDEDWKPCVANVYDFGTAVLFSMETQTTIGYGYSTECRAMRLT